MTISNLSIAPPSGFTDSLYIENTGTTALHILNSLTIGISPVFPPVGGSELIVSNSTLTIDGLLSGQFQDDGLVVIMNSSLTVTNSSLQVAAPLDFPINAVGFLSISDAIVQARDVSVSLGQRSVGVMEIYGGTTTLSSFLDVGGGDEFSDGSLLVANGASLVVTNAITDIGDGFQSSGTLTVSNAAFFAADVFLGGLKSSGTLTINNGTVSLNGQLAIGFSDQSFGIVSMNGGLLTVTNASVFIGFGSDGEMMVSDGLFLARDVNVGPAFSAGTLAITGGTSILTSNLQIGSSAGLYNASVSIMAGQVFITNGLISASDNNNAAQIGISGGYLAAKRIELGRLSQFPSGGVLSSSGGSITVSDGITLGNCVSNTLGYALINGGQLTVTNAAHTGFIDIQNGQLLLSGGTLRVDKLVMTNSCSSFVHTGGTLIVGSVVLDPNAFAITSVAREGNNLRVTWLMAPGQTNALQVSSGGSHGAYTNSFTDLFIVTNNTTAGTLTNYLDIGAATNKPSRYYRARFAP